MTPIDGEETQYGLQVKQLQKNIKIVNNTVYGHLNYVDEYEQFSSDPKLQKGNYIAMKVDAGEESDVTGEVVGGFSGPVKLTIEDRNFVARIADKDKQQIQFTVKNGKDVTQKTYYLKGLTVDSE